MDGNSKQNIQTQPTSSFYGRNRFKILGLLISIVLVFGIIVVSLNVFLISDAAANEFGGTLILTLIRIAFLIFGTPVAIILLFVGHRIDNAKNKIISYRYPLWVEFIGLILGVYLGLNMAVLWIVIFSVAQGTLWTDPILYIPLPVITPIITYLCFKVAQLIYSLIDKRATRKNLKLTLIVFVLSLPLFAYSGYALYQIYLEEASEATITITNFKEVPVEKKSIYTADITIPKSDEYNVTAYVGSKPSGTIRLNGIENIDGFNNFELTKGINKLIFYPDERTCTSASQTVSFQIRKVLANQLKLGNPKVITEKIVCP